MPIKPSWEERRQKALEIITEKPNNFDKSKDINEIINDIADVITKCLKEEGIKGTVLCINPMDINYEKIYYEYNLAAKGHIIWVTFTNSGHIAVVGAGTDINFSKSRRCGTWWIIDQLNKNIDWYKEKVIVMPIEGLDKSNGLKNVDNVLKCRNGVEHYVGECLISFNIPILNYFSHRNYSENFWLARKQNDYNL